MKALKLNKDNFDSAIQSEKPVLLDFYADWCGPCRLVLPIVEEIAGERDDVVVAKVNVDDEPELAKQFGIVSIPTLVVMKDGKVITKRGQSVLNAAVCSKAVADTITRALKAVTDDGGTAARRLKGAKAQFAGKTGTSFGTFPNGKYEDVDGKLKYQGTMVGFFPADDPQYSAICVVYSYPTRTSYQGGGIPARAIREVIDQIYSIDPYFREKTSR